DLRLFGELTAHELQQPLHAIVRMLAQAVEGRADGALLETALSSAHRLQDSIEGLLRYASVGKTQTQTIAADEIVEQALADLSVELDAAAAEVLRNPLPRVEADPTQLRSVFQNLIANAIRYRSDEPLRLEIGLADGALYVRDNGRGIDPGDHQRGFGFFRGGGAAGGVEGVGVGSGLGVARRIVEAHGGELWLESEPRRGTTFFFTVPLVP